MKQPGGGGGGGGGGQVAADLVGGRAGGVGANRLSSFQVRQFQGVNLTATRATIEDTEFAWLENIIPIGEGLARIVPGPEPPIATFAAPTGKPMLWSFIFGAVPYVYILTTNGALTQVAIPSGAVTVVGGPGSFIYGGCDLAGWQDSTLLTLDTGAGYRSWVPPAGPLTVLDAAKTGRALETFQGRAWLARTGRTIEFTAPNTFNDFTAAAGAGTVTISDNVFPGNLTALLNALEQLWIIGPGAINAISNVQTTGAPAVTTFSLTNIVTNVGTVLSRTVSTFFRTVLFNTQYGVYAIVGATPQKLSAKLDGLYPDLTFDATEHAAIGSVENVFTWVTRVTYWGEGTPRELLLCYASGKWFFASTPSLTNIVGVLVNGVPEIWATRHDGSLALFKLFADPEVPVAYRAVTKLYDLGRSWQTKQLLRVGLELQAPPPITGGLTLTADNESSGRVTPLVFETPIGIIIFVGTGVITFIGAGPITWIGDASGLSLARGGALGTTIGRYLGLTLSGTAPAWTLSAFLMQVRPSTDEEWA